MKTSKPYRKRPGTTFMRLAAAVCAAAMSLAAAGDAVRATGFRPPPHRMKARQSDTAKGSAKRLRATSLPSSWDSREHGWVTPVKDQNPLGTCWTFAANAVIETQLLKTGRGEFDLSEKNMALLCGFEGDWNEGGNNDMAAAHLLRWSGAVLEKNDIYFTNNNSYYNKTRARNEWENVRPSHPLNPALHIQNVVWVPALDGTEARRNELKEAIMKYGAVSTCIYASSTSSYMNGSAYYCNLYKDCDHAITVVGWDDNYSTNNFKSTRRPPSNGAWLIKNSWGASSGDGGYWHVSYCDKNFGMYDGAVFIPASSEENYTAVYGYDKFGPIYEPSDFDLQAVVFTSGWNEELAAVGFYTYVIPCPYEISIYTNVTRNAATPIAGGRLAARFSGELEHYGFTSIPLPSPIVLADRTTFSVVCRLTGSETSIPVCCTYLYYCYPQFDIGQSYFGFSSTPPKKDIWFDGADTNIVNQVDYTDEAWAACIKAYTRTTVAAKAGDTPEGDADGTDALAALAATNALAYAQHGETFGAFANIVGANGRTLWTNWLAGLDPADPDDDFEVSIAVTNGVPSLSWRPDLGAARNYTVFGRYSLSPESGWEVVSTNELATTSNRFFKVTLSP